jgi:hypothetical protein
LKVDAIHLDTGVRMLSENFYRLLDAGHEASAQSISALLVITGRFR